MPDSHRAKYEKVLLTFARAVTVGAAYVLASPIPGLTSSFVAIFIALLPFDIIIASERHFTSLKDWEYPISVLRPRVFSTANTLAKGITVGAVVGILCILGLPHIIGAVLTSGLAYIWALKTRYAISTYVAIFSGLALFERFTALEIVEPGLVLRESLAAIVSSGGGTFAALVVGWGVGLVVGLIVRPLLSRPYRSLQSAAYDLPLKMRPFNEVLHVGKKSLVVSVKVEEGSPVADQSLAESGLREQWQTTVLSIKRGKDENVMPKGSAVLLPGDELLVLTEQDLSQSVSDLFKALPPEEESDEASAPSEEHEANVANRLDT